MTGEWRPLGVKRPAQLVGKLFPNSLLLALQLRFIVLRSCLL